MSTAAKSSNIKDWFSLLSLMSWNSEGSSERTCPAEVYEEGVGDEEVKTASVASQTSLV